MKERNQERKKEAQVKSPQGNAGPRLTGVTDYAMWHCWRFRPELSMQSRRRSDVTEKCDNREQVSCCRALQGMVVGLIRTLHTEPTTARSQ
mmetsp:Transcript_32773/g.70285  ORF Transcript_32773/g.70285 Transcript_32773/m.70285 type:complete len:91 (-) Transcript_32773:66-338(-)